MAPCTGSRSRRRPSPPCNRRRATDGWAVRARSCARAPCSTTSPRWRSTARTAGSTCTRTPRRRWRPSSSRHSSRPVRRGITVATVAQARLFRRFGVQHILIANEVTDEAVDHLAGAGAGGRPRVHANLLRGQRRGGGPARPHAVRARVARGRSTWWSSSGTPWGAPEPGHCRRRATWPTPWPALQRLALVGVAGYEGSIVAADHEATLAAARAFCEQLGTLASELLDLRTPRRRSPHQRGWIRVLRRRGGHARGRARVAGGAAQWLLRHPRPRPVPLHLGLRARAGGAEAAPRPGGLGTRALAPRTRHGGDRRRAAGRLLGLRPARPAARARSLGAGGRAGRRRRPPLRPAPGRHGAGRLHAVGRRRGGSWASPTRAPRSTSGAGSRSSTTASTSSTWSAPSSEQPSVHPARAQAAAHGRQPANAAGGSPVTPGRCRKTEPARG